VRVMLWALHFSEYATLLTQALRKHSDVMLVVYADNASNELGTDFEPVLQRMGIAIAVLQRPKNPIDVLRNASTLIRLTKSFDPDVLHIQEDGRDELIAALLCFPRMPVVLTIHDPSPHSGHDARRSKYSRGRAYQAILRRRANHAITHGIALAREVGRVAPALRDRVWTIPHGPLGLLKGAPSGNRCIGSPVRLLFFGRIHAYKGLGYFVEAVLALKRRGVNVVGIVAGRGTDLEKYRATMHAAGCFELRERYIPSSEVNELFVSSDIVVLPYTDATQSGVAAMALGYGVPVIATTVGSIPEFVRDGENGLLVPPRDSAVLAAAIRRMLEQPGEYERFCANSLSLRDGQLSWAAIAVQTLACYKAARVRSGRNSVET
jgi:starch synthase